MGAGRFLCVSLPLLLTAASMLALLIATLSGVVHNQMWMFQLDTRNLSISPADAAHLAGKMGINVRDVKTDNITAADLNLADTYDVDLWGYCATGRDGKRDCTGAKFDWASSALNTSLTDALVSTGGVKIELPNEVKSALKTYRTISKWTQVAFILALVALAAQLVVGVLANCSRVVSCLVWLLSGVTTILVGAAAGLATATASLVIGAVDTSVRYYGVRGHVGGRFLATVWVATAFAIAAGVFWIFTICCCKPERRRKVAASRGLDTDGEKLLPTSAYRPISGNQFEMTGAQQGSGGGGGGFYNPDQAYTGYSPGPRHPSGQDRTDLAYEPYSHRA